MAVTNHERVGKALDALKAGLAPFVEREFTSQYGDNALAEARGHMREDRLLADKALAEWDATALLQLMWNAWNDVFRQTLGHAERSMVSELREVCNQWAHQQPFSSDDRSVGRSTDPLAVAFVLCMPTLPSADGRSRMALRVLSLARR